MRGLRHGGYGNGGDGGGGSSTGHVLIERKIMERSE